MLDFFGTADYAKKSDVESLRGFFSNELSAMQQEAAALRGEIYALRKDVNLKVTDSEEAARSAADNAVEAGNRVLTLESDIRSEFEKLKEISLTASEEVSKINVERGRLADSNKDLLSSIEDTMELYNGMLESKSEVDLAKAKINSNIEDINSALEKSEELPEAVEKVQELLASSSEQSSMIGDLLSHSASKKGEIDDLRDKILGKEMIVEGESVHVDGLKDKLEKSYLEIDSKIKNLDETVHDAVLEVKSIHDTQLSKHTEEFDNLVANSTQLIIQVDNQLKELLPGAMAAGLSAAYAKKKDDETRYLAIAEGNFKSAIRNMIIISTIPFAIDVYLLFWEKIGIIEVIRDTPNLLLAILPLYLPALWIAVSLNRKINLSKRLIEEYTHKEVLGKTFSGISNQIGTLKANDGIKEDLRTQLLFNLLHVSAENPGKLITDYNKSDHPLLSVLENSKKLTDSMGELAKIPGLGRITKILSERAEKKIEETAREVAEGLEINISLEGKVGAEKGEVQEKS